MLVPAPRPIHGSGIREIENSGNIHENTVSRCHGEEPAREKEGPSPGPGHSSSGQAFLIPDPFRFLFTKILVFRYTPGVRRPGSGDGMR
ncbi:MAG: hypothetical protein APR53_04655 [Methanoculleus sp. SDB]|nr:MAG: hypothetical protein APR53_04655 [Methanoculleus sp. SDB]